jgi:hypothetical protein
MRGYVTINKPDIQKYRRLFDQLRVHGRRLASETSGLAVTAGPTVHKEVISLPAKTLQGE